MEATNNLARDKIQAHLATLKLRTNDKFMIRGMLICLPCLILGLIVCLLFFYFKNYIPVAIGATIVFIGIACSLYFIINIQKISYHNQAKINNANQTLHAIYFENTPQLFDENLELKFEGIFPSKIFEYNCLHFTLGSEAIIWDIGEDVEIRTSAVYTGQGPTPQSYKVYILKYVLKSSAKKLTGISGISIKQGKTPKNDEDFLQSESIEFNARFKVECNDQMEAFKVFTPKVIDNFLFTESGFLGVETIQLRDGEALIEHHGSESLKSWVPEPLEYSKIHWSQKRMLDDLMKKVKTDFDRYLKVQKMLMPLDLYNEKIN